MAREPRIYDSSYGYPACTPRNSVRATWFAFCRGIGYAFARLVMGVFRRG